jgi:hypothetical protein
MSKTLKYAGNGAVIGGIGFMLINLIDQLIKIDENPELKFDWDKLLRNGVKGALVGGTTGALIGGVKDVRNNFEETLNTCALLGVTVSNIKLDKTESSYQKLSSKAEILSILVENNYKSKLGSHILRIGSTEDNTALSDEFDIDISIPFNPNSFSSTSDMYNNLLTFLKNNFHDDDLVKIRTQKKSIGLIFDIENVEYKIDMVPYKLSNKNKTSGYLFVNNDSAFNKDSYTKTDILSLKSIKLTPVQQKLLICLKHWKRNFEVPIGSHLLKMLILDAYKDNKGKISKDFTAKLLMVVLHIRNAILFKRIVSVENKNNILTNIKESNKRKISKCCDKILDEYDYQPNSILHYFT